MISLKEPGQSSEERLYGDTSPCSISVWWNYSDAEHLISTWRSQAGATEEYFSNELVRFFAKRCLWRLQADSARKWTCLAHASGQLALHLTYPNT